MMDASTEDTAVPAPSQPPTEAPRQTRSATTANSQPVEVSADTVASINTLHDLLSGTAVPATAAAAAEMTSAAANTSGRWKGFGILNNLLNDPAHNEVYTNVVNALKRSCEMNREELSVSALTSLQSVLDTGGMEAILAVGGSHGVYQQIDTILGGLVRIHWYKKNVFRLTRWSTVGLRIASPVICELSFHALAILATSSQVRQKINSNNVHLRIIRGTNIHIKILPTVVWGVVCLRMLTQDEAYTAKFISSNGVDAVLACMKKYTNCNVVIEHCCRIIYNISKESDEVMDFQQLFVSVADLL
jgi:hypothetical protein